MGVISPKACVFEERVANDKSRADGSDLRLSPSEWSPLYCPKHRMSGQMESCAVLVQKLCSS